MLVLHGSWLEDQLLIWGEAAGPAVATRSSNKRGVRPLPFDAGPDRLIEALCEEDSGLDNEDYTQTAILWLPTVAGQPVASSPLIAPRPDSSAKAELRPWVVTVIPTSIEHAIAVIASCFDQATLRPGIGVGTTLAYWTRALRFAGMLTAREQFLPGVASDGDGWRAAWTSVRAGHDMVKLNQLALAMPAACRSLSSATDAPPSRAPATVLSAFLDATVDHLVRAALVSPASASIRESSQGNRRFDSLHDQWLHRLRDTDGVLEGSKGELTGLQEQVHGWQRPVAVAVHAPYRLSFRLEEPAPEAKNGRTKSRPAPWTVRYLLQGREDPSLLVPVAEAWSPRGRQATVLHRDGFEPREYLLTALGQAASLCPAIETSLKEAAPAAFDTDATGAHAFLTEQAAVLEQAGFGVLLPAWWTRKGTKVRLTVNAHAKSPPMKGGGGGLGLDELVQFDWQIALGDHTLTSAELETLARMKVPLVQVRGQWVQVSAEEIGAALDFWNQRQSGRASVRELMKMSIGAAEAPGGLAIGKVTADGWVGDFLSELECATFAELAPPDNFQGALRPYQLRGYSWLAFLRRWGLGACLADDMGLGKTVQTLALLQRDWHAPDPRPTLLICPMSVVGNWQKEAARFTPDLPVLVHHGLERTRSAAFVKEARRHALVLSSYSLLHRDQELLQEVRWAGVILDEAQNIKNPETKQAKAACALKADYRIALTGTPVENHVGDLWSIWQFLHPGFLGNRAEFRRSFFVPIQLQQDADAAARLKRLTGPFLLRRLKTDRSIIADLPDKLEMKVYCNLTREQATLYAAVVEQLNDALNSSDGIKRKGIILATLAKLKQVCNHPAHFLGDNSPLPGRSGKLARLAEMLDEVLQGGERALVFTQFTEMGDLLQRHLQETFGREVLFLHGAVSRKQRDAFVNRFQSADGPPILLLSLKAGGTGLNLTAASHVFHFDRWWNPAVEDQATDRAFRIGQKRRVQVHKFLCVGTLEERIDEMIERKKDVAQRVVGAGEAWLTELNNDQLKDLLTLRDEALAD